MAFHVSGCDGSTASTCLLGASLTYVSAFYTYVCMYVCLDRGVSQLDCLQATQKCDHIASPRHLHVLFGLFGSSVSQIRFLYQSCFLMRPGIIG